MKIIFRNCSSCMLLLTHAGRLNQLKSPIVLVLIFVAIVWVLLKDWVDAVNPRFAVRPATKRCVFEDVFLFKNPRTRFSLQTAGKDNS